MLRRKSITSEYNFEHHVAKDNNLQLLKYLDSHTAPFSLIYDYARQLEKALCSVLGLVGSTDGTQ